MLRPAHVLIAVATLALGARADVIVLDPHLGDASIALRLAIESAQAGDILLLQADSYLGSEKVITIDEHGITLVADTPSGLTVVPALRVKQLPAGETLVMRGLQAAGTDFGSLDTFAAVEIITYVLYCLANTS